MNLCRYSPFEQPWNNAWSCEMEPDCSFCRLQTTIGVKCSSENTQWYYFFHWLFKKILQSGCSIICTRGVIFHDSWKYSKTSIIRPPLTSSLLYPNLFHVPQFWGAKKKSWSFWTFWGLLASSIEFSMCMLIENYRPR